MGTGTLTSGLRCCDIPPVRSSEVHGYGRGLELLDETINRIEPTAELGSGRSEFVRVMVAGV
jgi:hypothetical protein